MSNEAYTWTYVDTEGRPVAGTSPSFPSQAEAEAWIGEEWESVKDDGVDAVTLVRGDEVVYGPMSLHGSEA